MLRGNGDQSISNGSGWQCYQMALLPSMPEEEVAGTKQRRCTEISTEGAGDMTDRDRVVAWAKRMIEETFVSLDTETTGLVEDGGEPVQIGLDDSTGAFTLCQLIKPKIPVDETSRAYTVNRIGNKELEDAPTYDKVWEGSDGDLESMGYPGVSELIRGRNIIVYNKPFDYGILQNVHMAYGLTTADACTLEWHCAMQAFADYRSEPASKYHGYKYKWFRLIGACEYFGIVLDRAHDALADAQATTAIVRAIAAEIDVCL